MGFSRKDNKIDANIVTNAGKKNVVENNSVKEDTKIEQSIVELEKVEEKSETTGIVLPKRKKKNDNLIQTSIRFTPEALAKINELTAKSNDDDDENDGPISINAMVNSILNQIYDAKTGGFKIDIPPNPKNQKTTQPVKINRDIAEALKKHSNLKNMSSGEYFSKLFLEAVKKIK